MCTLNNMSCPPRTKAVMQGRPVSPQIVIFSMTYALVETGLVDVVPKAMSCLAKALDGDGSIRDAVLRRWQKPQDLFASLGDPTFLDVTVDFLIGWRPQREHLELPPVFCRDPRLCAGVLSRCAGNLYLSRRAPDLTWERLLDDLIAFDDPLVSCS
jgi:hypothetical protein